MYSNFEIGFNGNNAGNYNQAGSVKNLVNINNNSIYIQGLSLGFFFSKHWGIEANHQILVLQQQTQKQEQFEEHVRQQYQDFFVSKKYGFYNGGDAVNKVSVGGVYRYETDKFFIHPRVGVGLAVYSAADQSFVLKEKDAHDIVQLQYNSGQSVSFLSIASVKTGYRLRKRLGLYVHAGASYFKPRLNYIVTQTSAIQETSQTETIHFNKPIFSYNIGAGLQLSFVVRK